MVPLIRTNLDGSDAKPSNETQPEELPLGEDKTAYVHAMFDRVASRYDRMNRLISLGLDRSWRRRALRVLALAPGSLVADIGTGTADLARELRVAGYRSLGVDLSMPMLRAATGDHGPLLQADASGLPLAPGTVDGVVSGFALRNFTDLRAVFAELARITRPSGRLCFLEVDTPTSPLVHIGHRLWFNEIVPRLGALSSDPAAYRYLPRSVTYLPGHEELAALLTEAGFGDVERIPLFGAVAQLVTATRAGDYGIRVDRTKAS